MTRSGVIARNTVLNVAGQGIPLAVGAITIPFTMRWLGADRFGILALVWVLIGYLNVFDLGLGRATTKFVAEAMARDERDIPSVVGTALTAQVILGSVGAAALWLGAPLLVTRVLNLPADLAGEARSSFALLALAAPVVLVSTSARSILEAAQRFVLVNTLRAPIGALHFLLPLLGAAAGWPLPQIVLSILLLHATGMAAQYLACVRVFPSLLRPRVDLRTLRKLLGFGGWVAVSGVVGPVLVYIDRFAIAALISIGAVGWYAAPYELVTRLSIIPIGLAVTLFPVFSAGRETPRDLEALAARSLRSLILGMGAIVVVTIALAGDVVRIWLGRELAEVVTVPFQILAVGVLMNALAYVPFSLLQAIGRADVTAKIHLVELPIHLMLVWVLINAFGLTGAALAWSIRVAIDTVLLFAAAGRLGALRFGAVRDSGVLSLVGSVAILGAAALGFAAVPSLPLRVGALVASLGIAAAALLFRRPHGTLAQP